MARPPKNYCDYFSHDRDMRDHKKIKAIRTKFGITGYGIWCMLLEYLTGNDGNVFEYSDLEFELMAGDFGVSVTEIRDTVDYCIKLELLFLNEGFVNSESLDHRLKSVYDKRGVAKARSAKQDRTHGKFTANNSESIGISVTETTQDVTEMPQSKVNESKVNESSNTTPVGVVSPAQAPISEKRRKTDFPKLEIINPEAMEPWYDAEIVSKLHEKTESEAQTIIANYIKEKKPAFYRPYMHLWNLVAKRTGIAQIDDVPAGRMPKFKARIKEPAFDFLEILRAIKRNPSLRGEGKNGWKITWDFVFKNDTNYLSVIEQNKALQH